jgi:TPP-dependent pyruvate/acetoin dehydrogenase alpha subunit
MTELGAVESEVTARIDRAVEIARSAAPPVETDLLMDVYVSY